MGVVEDTVELVSSQSIFQSTTMAVLGMVSVLYLYRRLTTSDSQLKPGEVKGAHTAFVLYTLSYNAVVRLTIVSCWQKESINKNILLVINY